LALSPHGTPGRSPGILMSVEERGGEGEMRTGRWSQGSHGIR
jgi:hypothetical protein